jgi:predicted porin
LHWYEKSIGFTYMKKHAWRLFAAVLFSGSIANCHAASGITVSGEINLAVIRYDVENSTGETTIINRLDSYTSRMAIKGKEDLGDGLSADFLMGSGFRANDGRGGFCNRECWVRLKGSLGAIKLGRTLPIYDDVSLSWYRIESPGIHNPLSLWANCSSNAGLTSGCFDVFQSDSIRYDTPAMAGFAGSFSASAPAEELPTGRKGRVYVLGGTYQKGAIYVGIASQAEHDIRGEGLVDHGTTLAVAYTGPVYVGVGFERLDYAVPTGGMLKRNYLGGIVSYTRNVHTFWANYGVASRGRGSAPGSYNVNAVQNVERSGAAMWTLGYEYKLSMQTRFSVFYNVIANDANGVYSFDPALTPLAGVGGRLSGLAFGMQKRF